MKPEQLTAWALNELSAEERAQVEAALAASPQAQESALEVKAFCDLLNEELGQDESSLRADQRDHLRALVPTEPVPAFRLVGSARQRSLRSIGAATGSDWKQGWWVRVAAMAACALMVGVVIYRATKTTEPEVAHVPVEVPPPLVAEDVRVSAGMTLPKAVPAPSKTLEPKHEAPALAQALVPDSRTLLMPDPVGRADSTMNAAIPPPSAVKLSSAVTMGAALLPGRGFIETARLPVAVVNMAVNPIPLTEVQGALSSNQIKGLRVRASDLINSFAYSYEPPHADEAEPIRVSATMVNAPWESSHRLVRVAMQARLGADEVVARDVRLEVVFDPTQVSAYRMLGYEPLAGSTTDSVSQGVTMKAGQAFTALFEVVPANEALPKDQLLADGMAPNAARKSGAPKPKAATRSEMPAAPGASPIRVRVHFQSATSASAEVAELLVPSTVTSFESSDADFQFATALAGVGWLMATPEGPWQISWDLVKQWAARSEAGRAERVDFVKILNSLPTSK
ncbi:MAG: von Willebrand factor type A domain-containing protein [Verrucomicrobiaceae bacterium]|nr:von Willebrand factor type A domain-containing protein [Verrucomicrobiaceae bacterium]